MRKFGKYHPVIGGSDGDACLFFRPIKQIDKTVMFA